MARTKESAADYIERRDAEMRIILGEFAEYAANINVWWTNALDAARENPELALSNLYKAELHLGIHVRIEVSDSLRRIRSAIKRLESERPPSKPRKGKRSQRPGVIGAR